MMNFMLSGKDLAAFSDHDVGAHYFFSGVDRPSSFFFNRNKTGTGLRLFHFLRLADGHYFGNDFQNASLYCLE